MNLSELHCNLVVWYYMQLFLRKAKYVKPGLEETKWKELSYQCMTEESGGESSEEIVSHQLPWRSECEFH